MPRRPRGRAFSFGPADVGDALVTAARAVAPGTAGAASAGNGRGHFSGHAGVAPAAGTARHELVRFRCAAIRAGREFIPENQFLEVPAAFFAAIFVNGHVQSFARRRASRWEVSAAAFSKR